MVRPVSFRFLMKAQIQKHCFLGFFSGTFSLQKSLQQPPALPKHFPAIPLVIGSGTPRFQDKTAPGLQCQRHPRPKRSTLPYGQEPGCRGGPFLSPPLSSQGPAASARILQPGPSAVLLSGEGEQDAATLWDRYKKAGPQDKPTGPRDRTRP